MSAHTPPPVAVLGAGNWGTTVALLVTIAGRPVKLWTREVNQRDEINREHTNRRYTGDHTLPESLVATSDLADAVLGAELILDIIPSKGFRSVARELGTLVTPDQILVHGTKGLELGTHERMSEIVLQETCLRQIGVLSGPNIANEILQSLPAGTVVASRFPRVLEVATAALSSPRMRVFQNDDVLGVELAGAFKNVVAIAAGIAHAMGLGDNAKAMLVTRGITEMAKLAVALGAQPSTFFGMAGIGDLVVTCASPYSRNGRLGAALAQGKTLKEAQESLGMVAEGVNTARTMHELAREAHLDLPLTAHVFKVLYEGLAPRDALRELMAIPPSADVTRLLRSEAPDR